MNFKRVQLASAVVLAVGLCHCGDSSECPAGFECIPVGGGGNGGEASAGGGGSVGTQCEPIEGHAIGADCGVFVKAGSGGTGTQDSPLGSVVQASESLGDATRIYVCGSDSFAGSVALPGGVSIYGSLSCDGWVYTSNLAHPKIIGDEDLPALTIAGPGATQLISLDVEAPDALIDGGSSVGVVVAGTSLTAYEMRIVAHDGRDGALPPDQEAQLPRAQDGQDGAAEGASPANALGGTNQCGNTTLIGGPGGKGGDHTAPVKDGGNGGFGDQGSGGVGGVGESSAMQCGYGANANPVNDAAASGDGAEELGEISAAGFSPATGGPGVEGTHGASGGGGGGARANSAVNGGGGGAGGAGGCGGHGGIGGAGAGSSIGLISVSANVVLDETVTIVVGAGGAGGDGAKGQVGQSAGSGGDPPLNVVLSFACSGGSGSHGEHGGNGGGGRGGHAIAMAYAGTAPIGGTPDMTDATAGAGGLGGQNETALPGGDGEPGVSDVLVAF